MSRMRDRADGRVLLGSTRVVYPNPRGAETDEPSRMQYQPPSFVGVSADSRPIREFRNTRMHRVETTLAGMLARAGIGPFWLLTTRGRKTGRQYTNPVTLVEEDGKSWLVAPYGPVSWVLNARAAGRVAIRRGRSRLDYAIRELGLDEAAPILKRYVSIASATRPYFQAGKDAPVEAFRAEAHRHPVFELTLLDAERP